MISVGVVGYGYWGPNLVRNFYESPHSRVIWACDGNPDRLSKVKDRYPTIDVTSDFQKLISDPSIDAIVIATPVSSHYPLAIESLRAGKHVLLEKPLTETSEQAITLIEEASKRNLILMVDHTFVYTGAVQKIRDLVINDGLGDIYYFDSVRVNLGLFQHDVNVIWDLAVHDLSIMDYVLPIRPNAVSATGVSHLSGEPENIAYITLFFDSQLLAHVHVNWLAPVKVRRTLIGGTKKMILYDDVEPSEKVKVYDKGVEVNNGPESIYKLLVSYRTGDMWAPKFDTTEALKRVAAQFLECIEKNQRPITDGETGLRVVRILEAATRSMKAMGRPEPLDIH